MKIDLRSTYDSLESQNTDLTSTCERTGTNKDNIRDLKRMQNFLKN